MTASQSLSLSIANFTPFLHDSLSIALHSRLYFWALALPVHTYDITDI